MVVKVLLGLQGEEDDERIPKGFVLIILIEEVPANNVDCCCCCLFIKIF